MDATLRKVAPCFAKRNRIEEVPEDLRPGARELRRFFQNCDDMSPQLDRCVRWRGHCNGRRRPYPQFWFRGKNRTARQLMWLWFGDKDAKLEELNRLMLRTTCQSHTCVNPTHLKRIVKRQRTKKKKKPLGLRRRRHRPRRRLPRPNEPDDA